jgi:hypothetical protein
MKKFLATLCFLVALVTTMAQNPPPPPPGGHGQSGNQLPAGGNAPVGSGMVVLLGLAVAYAAGKSIKNDGGSDL